MNTGERQKEFLPNLLVVKFDETMNWSDDIQQKAGKIYGYYLVDTSEITHCAELTGSYYCRFLYNRVENIDAFVIEEDEDSVTYSDELEEIEYGGSSENTNIYVPEFTKLDVVSDSYCEKYSETELQDFLEESAYEDFIEEAIEYFKCNPVE